MPPPTQEASIWMTAQRSVCDCSNPRPLLKTSARPWRIGSPVADINWMRANRIGTVAERRILDITLTAMVRSIARGPGESSRSVLVLAEELAQRTHVGRF